MSLLHGGLPLLAHAVILPLTATAQGVPTDPLGEYFDGSRVVLGATLEEAKRVLFPTYDLRGVDGASGIYQIVKRSAPSVSVGSITIAEGHVAVISTDWTPKVDDTGAFAEAVADVLTRLTVHRQDSWTSSRDCVVLVANNLHYGTSGHARVIQVACGPRRLSLSITRDAGTLPSASLSLELGSVPPRVE